MPRTWLRGLAGFLGAAIAAIPASLMAGASVWTAVWTGIGASAGAFTQVWVDAWNDRLRRKEAVRQLAEQAPRRSIARLLRPDQEVVPFFGRIAELNTLRTWCREPSASPLRLMTGAGGVGKTRLARQLQRELAEQGWVGSFVAQHENIAVDLVRNAVSRPTLLIIDYAETRDGLGDLVRRTALLGRSQQSRIRILLLARSAGDWWDRLGIEDPGSRALVETTAPLALNAEPDPHGTAKAVVLAAIPHFAAVLGVATPLVTTVNIPVPGVPVLVLHAIALLTVLRDERSLTNFTPSDGAAVSAESVITAVIGELLGHEARLCVHGLPESLSGLSVRGCRRAVAMVCLRTAESESQAVKLTTLVPDLAETGVLRDAAWWLRGLYPPSESGMWWGSLQPDLLAEHLTCETLSTSPQLAEAVFSEISESAAIRSLTVLTRAASHHHAAASLVHEAVRLDPERFARALIYVAVRSSAQIGAMVADILAAVPLTLKTLIYIERNIPFDSAELARADLVVIERIIAHISPNSRPGTRARWLTKLAYRLRSVGRADQASPLYEESVAVYRELVSARPTWYLPALASALNGECICLLGIGRPDDAVKAAAESIECWQRLRDIRPDVRSAAELADSLNSLGGALSIAGRGAEALPATEQAVAAYRALHVVDPGKYDTPLANALSNLGIRYATTGRHDEALSVTKTAVAMLKSSATENMDGRFPLLANSLENLSNRFADVNEHGNAAAAAQRAAQHYKRLADSNPDIYAPRLAAIRERLAAWGVG